MRINEAYEHEPLLSGKAAEGGQEGCCGCERTGRQCVDVTASVEVTPKVQTGPLNTCCKGEPVVDCVTSPDGSHCTVTFTQRLCFALPLRYGVDITPGDPTIACAGDMMDGKVSGCGCGKSE